MLDIGYWIFDILSQRMTSELTPATLSIPNIQYPIPHLMPPQTFTQKAIARAAGLDQVAIGEIVTVQPDRILSHDNSAAIARIFQRIGVEWVRQPERVVIVLDHAVPAPSTLHATNHAEIRQFVREQRIPHFFDAGRGICHQVVSEEALILPGQMILGADSHTTHAGWLGAFGAGVGRSEVAALWATGELWLRVPEAIRIQLTGALRPGVTAKDLGLWILRALGQGGAAYRALEFTGEGVRSLSVEQRMVLPNLMAEAGAKNAYMIPDETVFDWLAERIARQQNLDASETAVVRRRLVQNALYPDADAPYIGVLEVDLHQVAPAVARPHSPDNVTTLSDVAGTPVDQAFLGTCTNGRLADLAAAAAVLTAPDGSVRQVAEGTRLVVIPASREVMEQAMALGYIQTFVQAGAMIGTPGCGPCMGNHFGVPAPGERVISTGNRNFRGRMGTRESEVYLSSPAVVAASAVAGRITAPESDQYSDSSEQYAEPQVQWLPTPDLRSPISDLRPRTSGQISRGRVWKYGDNINTDVIFPGKYTYTLRTPEEFAAHALEDLDPEFAANVQPGDIIVAGENWGAGSSREQAVTALKAAGIRIIIAKSFARIYFRNMVNNGMLPIIAPEAVGAIQSGETVSVDAGAQVIRCAAGEFPFPPLSPTLQSLLDAGGLIPKISIESPTN